MGNYESELPYRVDQLLWPVLGAGRGGSSSQKKFPAEKKTEIKSWQWAMGQEIWGGHGVHLLHWVCAASVMPTGTGRDPSHSHHMVVLGCPPVCPTEVPCPPLNQNLCLGECSALVAFIFSPCLPSNPSLWQETGSC